MRSQSRGGGATRFLSGRAEDGATLTGLVQGCQERRHEISYPGRAERRATSASGGSITNERDRWWVK